MSADVLHVCEESKEISVADGTCSSYAILSRFGKARPLPDADWCSFDHDIPNAAQIDREYCVTQLRRIQAFQRMTVYGTVAKDVRRDKWKTIPKAMEAIAAEWARLRAQNVWDEAHPRTLGSVQAEAKRNNKTIHIGRLFDLCVEKHSELAAHLRK